MSVTRSYESHSYSKSADYFEQSFEYSQATSGARETCLKTKTHLAFSESFDDDSKSEPVPYRQKLQ
uniref:Uncharacterized protein n=1 Tax=Strigamia maritima TaxID=126957 RepID=T1JKD6_STRMM